MDASAIVAVDRQAGYVYVMTIKPPYPLAAASSMTVSVKNHYGSANRTFRTTELLPAAAKAAVDVGHRADIVRAAVVLMSVLIAFLVGVCLCLVWKFRRTIAEHCKCGEYLVVDDYEEDQIVVVHSTAPDEVMTGRHVPKTTEL